MIAENLRAQIAGNIKHGVPDVAVLVANLLGIEFNVPYGRLSGETGLKRGFG